MKRRRVLLVNPNLMKPPIAPIGLEYLADVLTWRGHEPVLCDLAWAEDWRAELEDAIVDVNPVAIGLSVRNLDDAYFASQDFILERTAKISWAIRELTEIPLILGGVGFSIAPREVLEFLGADLGIAGENEESMADLADALVHGRDVSRIPGLVWRSAEGTTVMNALERGRIEDRHAPVRRLVDNVRYYTEGGQAGIETKRGCERQCIFCVEPWAKGRSQQLRDPDNVADEIEDLLEQGIDTFHLCDSEFNFPPKHAHAVCEGLIRRGLDRRIRWYCYAKPVQFDIELALAMKSAGCVGIDFGADHADPGIIRSLGLEHTADDLRRTAASCREAGLVFMFDMLLGGPGETRESMARAIDLMRVIKPDRVGLSCGARVYPNTPLARRVRAQGPLHSNPNLHGATRDNEGLLRPVFYVDAALDGDIHQLVWELVGGDPRFLTADPARVGNYNYNDNAMLEAAIRAGARGAYWDILRRIPEE